MDIQGITFAEVKPVQEPVGSPTNALQSQQQQSQQEVPSNKTIPSREEAQTKVDTMNSWMQPHSTALKFQYHEKLNDYYVQVVNSVTDEIVREIPSRKFLDYFAAVAEKLGLVVDERY